MIGLVFGVGNGRTQMVLVTRHMLMNGTEEWVQISSPIGEVGQINVEGVLRDVGDMVCGGVVIEGKYLVVRDALPLANLQVNEFERPFVLVTTTADRLEQKYVGSDIM